MKMDVTPPAGLDGFVAGIASSLEFGRDPLKRVLQELTPEQLVAVPSGLTNSIATLVVHICAVELSIAHRLQNESVSDTLKAEYLLNLPQSPLPAVTGETVESLFAKMDQSRAALAAAMSRLTAADLDREFHYSSERSATFRFLLALLPHHQGLHLGHIQYIKKLIG